MPLEQEQEPEVEVLVEVASLDLEVLEALEEVVIASLDLEEA